MNLYNQLKTINFSTATSEAIDVAAGGFHGTYRIRRRYAITIFQSPFTN
ncbi:MAG: hypothetical protein QF879_07805 [Candidatus Latescibacteria bacterium]|jgi:hypothetical protein|nr:hypothetical protein [Candidatus Latescibacterota bacterium]